MTCDLLIVIRIVNRSRACRVALLSDTPPPQGRSESVGGHGFKTGVCGDTISCVVTNSSKKSSSKTALGDNRDDPQRHHNHHRMNGSVTKTGLPNQALENIVLYQFF